MKTAFYIISWIVLLTVTHNVTIYYWGEEIQELLFVSGEK